MATFSKKMMGKEVGDASVYAKPHTMDGKPGTGAKVMQDPNTLAANKMTRYTATPRVSDGDPGADHERGAGVGPRRVVDRRHVLDDIGRRRRA